MLRSVAPLAGAVLLTGCTVVHPAPVAPPRPPAATAPVTPTAPAAVPPPVRPRLVLTAPDAGTRPPAGRERRRRLPPPAPPAPAPREAPAPGPAAPGTGDLCATGVRLHGIPAGWEAVCRAAMGG